MTELLVFGTSSTTENHYVLHSYPYGQAQDTGDKDRCDPGQTKCDARERKRK